MRYQLNDPNQYFKAQSDGGVVVVSGSTEVRLVLSDLQRWAMAVLDSGVSIDFDPSVQLVPHECLIEIDGLGTRSWLNAEGGLHREDGPAVEWIDGGKEWWIDGKRHREDGPAIVWPNGGYEEWYKEWWINGERHREDGPAVEQGDYVKWWYIHGKRHRKNGPAVAYVDGTKEWWLNNEFERREYFNKAGQRHRKSGPAVEYADGRKEWWIDGNRVEK